MCGIAGVVSLTAAPIEDLGRKLSVMKELVRHRGPDGTGTWQHASGRAGLAHQRLTIIDLSAAGAQPMGDGHDNWISFNGEIYNYLELRKELGEREFLSHSDTETILRGWRKWGPKVLDKLRGMFAFAIWDEKSGTLFAARDRFGIKPLYYAQVGGVLYLASEAKALLPFVDRIETDIEGLKDYLAFQLCLGGKTLFKGIRELPPGHSLTVKNGNVEIARYWEVYYRLDFEHTQRFFEERIHALIEDSVQYHLRSDVPLGGYVSGGFDSSLVATLAAKHDSREFLGFTGKFAVGPDYDESRYARAVAAAADFPLHEIDIQPSDFVENLRRVIYHLDYPVAGPGSFPQFMVSGLAAKHRKVVLGGQGGDEIFGGYARYLVAYFEQCIKGAIEGTLHTGNFIVTYESIIPNLTALQQYKPMLQDFWRDGLFEDIDHRYFRLISRTPTASPEIRWELLGDYSPFESFQKVFRAENVGKQSYFDLMTHFDFKTLLPALLQVEDRVSMAHGLEARVPFLDHPLVEAAATIPSNVKFKDGTMKHVLKAAMGPSVPALISERKDKMGFPVPLTEWVNGPAREFVLDVFSGARSQQRALVDNKKVVEGLARESRYGRKIWGLLCLELWQQEFHDKEAHYKGLLRKDRT